MADPRREALLCRTSALSSWLIFVHCLSAPAGESLLSLLLFGDEWWFFFSPSVAAHFCLDLLLVFCALPITAWPSLHIIEVIAPIKIIFMGNASPYETLQPWEKVRLSESAFGKPSWVAWVIQIFVVLVKISWSFCHALKLPFFFFLLPPSLAATSCYFSGFMNGMSWSASA